MSIKPYRYLVESWLIYAKHLDRNLVFIYTSFGSLWLLVFAQLLLLGWLQPVQNWGFLLITSGLLYVLLRRSKQSLQQAEHKYRLLFENAIEGIYQVTPNGQYHSANPALARIYGYNSPEELIAKLTWQQLEADAAYRAEFMRLLQESDAVSGFELHVERPDGSSIWTCENARAVRDTSGKLLYYEGTVEDITSRKRIDKAESERLQLLEREQVARADSDAARSAAEAARNQSANILESITDAFFALDNEWRFTYLNRQAEPLLQKTREELLGKNVWEEFPEAVSYTFYREYHKAVLQQVSVAFEEFYPPLNTWFEVRAYPSKDGLSVYFNDINERKRAEAALRESEERFRQMAENINQVFWMCSRDMSQMLYVSPAYEEIWGKSCASLYEQPRSWIESIHPEDRESVFPQEKQPIAEIDNQYRIVRPDGSVRWIRDRAVPVQDSSGQVYRVVRIAEDITERKRGEQEVQLLQTMTQAIIQSEDFDTALGVSLQKVCEATGWDFGEAWIPRSDGTVLECSPAWYSRVDSLEEFRRGSEGFTFTPGTGIPGRVWVSKQPEWRRDVSAESNQTYVRAEIALKAGLKAALGIPIVNDASVLAVLLFYMFESRDEDKRLIELISASTELGLFMQRKKAEEEVRKALDKEKELSLLKTRFVSMTSHEFRTPLATISLSSGILETYGSKWGEEKKQTHWQRINTAVQRMTSMLDDMLLLARAEAGNLEFKPAPLDLQAMLSEIIAEMQLTAGERYTLTFVTHGQYPGASTGTLPLLDEKLLRHILTNLLSNAIKYSPLGGNIQCEIIWHNREVILCIQDEGIGIPKEDQKRLFENFHRATNVGTIPGTGLGLSIIKKFVELHKGEITLQSQVGVGTTFTVKLPLLSS